MWARALLLAVLGLGLAPLCPASPQQQVIRRSLERDILRHTIHYLKTKLVKCLREIPASRHKRKVHMGLSPLLDFEVDMAVMTNTKDYLVQRVVACHADLTSSRLPILGTAPVSRNQPDRLPAPAPRAVTTTPSTTPATTTTTTPSTTTPTTTTSTTTTTTMLPPTTTAPPKPIHFSVDGRTISCEHGQWRDEGRVLRCRNLRVDGYWRLPNWDICLPGYNADAWRHLDQIQRGTFKVLDLRSLCGALGSAVNLVTTVSDVRVCWDCGETQARLSWLAGKWAGTVEDNGFLRDIECAFDAPIRIT